MTRADESPRAADATRMRAIADGDEAAFRVVYDAHYAGLHRIAYGVLLNREDAREVVQDAFVQLLKIAPRWRPDARIHTWLCRVTVNLSLSSSRRVRRMARATLAPSSTPTADSAVAALELHTSTRRALATLSPRQRAVTTLHLAAELEPAEIAPILGVTANAARVNLHRGLARLREALAEQHPTRGVVHERS